MIFHYKVGDPNSHKELGKKLSGLNQGEYTVEIKRNRPIRSISANRYYFGVVLKVIVMETQQEQDIDQMHETFKMMFNPQVIEFKNGRRVSTAGSTSDMDSKEFSIFVQRVKDFARRELGIIIPEPQDVDYLKWAQINESYSNRFDGI